MTTSGLLNAAIDAAELIKRGLQTSVTFRNAKAVDLMAYNPITRRSFVVQVKALRSKNFFLLGHDRGEPSHTCVFVLLNKPEEQVQYFIVAQ